MIIDIGIIDLELLKHQTTVIGELADGDGYGTNTDEEKEVLEGVWNLLEQIIDQIEGTQKEQIPAGSMRTKPWK